MLNNKLLHFDFIQRGNCLMDIQKPKKALRGLFSRTEPEIQPEENKQIQKINSSESQN